MTPDSASRFEALRIRGHRGGVIQPHRSMAAVSWGPGRLAQIGLLSGLALAGYGLLLPGLLSLWQGFFAWARDRLGLPVLLGEQVLRFPGGAMLRFPELSVTTPQPGTGALLTAAITGACVLGLTFLLPHRLAPIRSFLRLLVIVQASAILFFAASVDPFPFRVADYLFALMNTGLIAMALVPSVLSLALYPTDLSLARKLAITAAMLVHFAVLTPLLVLLHAWLVLRGTAVIIPVLYAGFGVLPYPLAFLGWYGWALSWPGESERRETRAPVHSP